MDQLVVPERELDGQGGYWVVTPLEMSDGSIIPVVRGWTAESDAATAVAPTGKVVVTVFFRQARARRSAAAYRNCCLPVRWRR